MLGTTEIILIVVVILLLFGAKRLPGLIRGAAKGMKDFKKELEENEDQPGKLRPDGSSHSPGETKDRPSD